MYVKEVIHSFTCIFCDRFWSIALPPGGEHNILNKELHCPWCGRGYEYLTDDDYR